MVKSFVISRFLSSVDGGKLYFTRGFTSVRPAGPAVIPRVHARGQYLGQHRFCHILKTSWWMNIILSWYVGSVGHKHWPEFMYMYVDQWPIFHGPVILPYILKTVWWTKVIIGILVPCDAKIDLIKCMWVSDLHFMVQWFCLISCFGEGMLYWRYWFSVTFLPTNIYVGQWPIFCNIVILP